MTDKSRQCLRKNNLAFTGFGVIITYLFTNNVPFFGLTDSKHHFSGFDPVWVKIHSWLQHDERGRTCALCKRHHKSGVWVKTTSMYNESSGVHKEAITKENNLRGRHDISQYHHNCLILKKSHLPGESWWRTQLTSLSLLNLVLYSS